MQLRAQYEHSPAAKANNTTTVHEQNINIALKLAKTIGAMKNQTATRAVDIIK